MGKKDKNKKKGKGAEKTAAKTDKKQSNKLKKELQKCGEDDIETIIAQIERDANQRLTTSEQIITPPSRRVNFTLIPHPDREQLILFGGEFFNGQKTFLYSDLIFFTISTNQWTVLKASAGPPPRCGHQMVASSANGGQLWLFGGEFASPSQAQFYHYRDLWLYHLSTKKWEKITAAGGPTARSGHRMVYSRKKLIVFGGFHDNLRDYKYFNDLFVFDTESYKWLKIELSGTAPAPRSGCCMAALNDGRILIYGGYSKEKVKKDVDKGRVFSDSFVLTPEKNDATGLKWKWAQVKLGGAHFSPRCSMSMTVTPNNSFAYCYGGVFDTDDDDEDISSCFYNDFYQLDLEKLTWRRITVGHKPEKPKKNNVEVEKMDAICDEVKTTTIADDGVFKVTVGPTLAASVVGCSSEEGQTERVFQPSARINAGLAIKHGVLYLFGGMCEDGDKQVTFNDLYSVDLKKMDEWKAIVRDDTSTMEWLGSDSETESDASEDNEEEEDEEGDDDSEMDTN